MALTVAQRAAARRDRQAQGIEVRMLEVYKTTIEQLMNCGLIDAECGDDDAMINRQLGALLCRIGELAEADGYFSNALRRPR